MKLISLLILLLATQANATTWRVEQDGSGDFSTIPESIAASSPGDTILIGPGRFTETVDFVFAGTTSTDVYVPVSVDSLTLIGSGRGVTIIGPTEQSITQHGPKGITAPLGITRLVARGMTIENVRHGAYLAGKSDILDMTIQNCELGIWEFTTDSVVSASEFNLNEVGINTGDGCRGLSIVACKFVDNRLGVGANRTQGVNLGLCELTNSNVLGTALQYAEGSSGTIEDCRMTGVGDGVVVRADSEVTLNANVIHAIYLAVNVFDQSVISGSQNILRGNFAAVAFATTSYATLEANHILKTGNWAVWCTGYTVQPVDIDLRNNYWGTDNADSISAWIFDGNDPQDPPWEANLSNVLYEPFSPVPLPAREASVGGLKSLFRRR